MEFRKCKLGLQENITVFFFETLTNKNCSFELVNTYTALNASRVRSEFIYLSNATIWWYKCV